MKIKALLGLTVMAILLATGCATGLNPMKARHAPILIDNFESGQLTGWTADPNWHLDDNTAGGWYQGWQGKWFAWSGNGGEAKTGTLRSKPFTLQRDGVEVSISGWSDVLGHNPTRWNYVVLKQKDGKELDRAYTPNATRFVPTFLNGHGAKGQEVYLEAVDDAAEGSFSMICIDDVSQSDAPVVAAPPRYKPIAAVGIENNYYRIEVTRKHGLISRLRDKAGDVEFIREPRLAGNFKFTLPLRGEAAWQATEGNYILGEQQRLTTLEKTDSSLKLFWAGPLKSVTGGVYDVDVTMMIKLVEDRVEFKMTVNNRSAQEVGELYYPMLGGTLGLTPLEAGKVVNPKDTVLVLPGRAGNISARIFQNFDNQSWLGIFGPEQHYSYPDQLAMPWMDFYHPGLDRGLFFGAVDPIARFKVMHLEQFPGVAGARAEGNWPRQDELNGLATGVRICCVQMPYHPAHSVFEATPIVVRAHAGDWKAMAAAYGKLAPMTAQGITPSNAAPAPAAPPQRFLVCDGPPWEKLTEQAHTAAAQGFDALLVNNWRDAKPDSGQPWFALPADAARLQASKAAIAACHAAGVRVFFVMDIEPARQHNELFDTTLASFVCVDRWTTPDTIVGWSTGETHVNSLSSVERRSHLNPGSPGYREILAKQTAALAELGVDGIHLRRFFGRVLDFNVNLKADADRASWDGGLQTLAAMTNAARAHQPAFAISMDDAFDQALPYVFACGTGAKIEPAALRQTYPGWHPILTVTKPHDLDALDHAALQSAVVQVQPEGGPAALAQKEWVDCLQNLKLAAPR